MSWDARVDLDLHCQLPSGEVCYYSNKNPESYVSLDVDKQAHHYPDQVENIYLDKALAPAGEYIIKVRLYSNSSGKTQTNWTSTFNNTASGEAKQRETAGVCSNEQKEVEVVRFVL